MRQTKIEFLTMMLNDPGMRQRNGNAQDRRRACEALWDEKQAAAAEPVAEAEADPAPVEETEAVPDVAKEAEPVAPQEDEKEPDLQPDPEANGDDAAEDTGDQGGAGT